MPPAIRAPGRILVEPGTGKPLSPQDLAAGIAPIPDPLSSRPAPGQHARDRRGMEFVVAIHSVQQNDGGAWEKQWTAWIQAMMPPAVAVEFGDRPPGRLVGRRSPTVPGTRRPSVETSGRNPRCLSSLKPGI